MKERLLQLLDLEHLTPSKFADLIGVQRSSVSHVISGRNNPSFDFIQKTLKAFPGLKADWLMLGEGPVYEQMGRDYSGNLFEKSGINEGKMEEASGGELSPNLRDRGETLGFEPAGEKKVDLPAKGEAAFKPEVAKDRKIVQVMILYDDDTFSTFKPSQ
jgi:transcriptional regulator with XRE-family HTH domain